MLLKQRDLPTGYLSHSQVSSYLNCPKQYEWHYIIKPPKIGKSPTMEIGSSLHNLIADVLLAKINKQRINTNKGMKLSRENLHQQLIKIQSEIRSTGMTFPDSEIKLYLKQHDELFKEWLKEILPEFTPTAVESEINTTVGGYPFVMYIDAIHKGKKVVDWKVTKSPKNKYNIASSLQLSLYSLGTELDDVAFCSLIRPKDGQEKSWKPKVKMISGTRTKAERDWAIHVVKSAAKGIRAGNFPVCSPENFLCDDRYCDYYPICRGKERTVDPKWLGAFA